MTKSYFDNVIKELTISLKNMKKDRDNINSAIESTEDILSKIKGIDVSNGSFSEDALGDDGIVLLSDNINPDINFPDSIKDKIDTPAIYNSVVVGSKIWSVEYSGVYTVRVKDKVKPVSPLIYYVEASLSDDYDFDGKDMKEFYQKDFGKTWFKIKD